MHSGDLYHEHFMHDFPGCKRDTRDGFANALRNVDLPATLEYVQIDFINDLYQSVGEQRMPLPNLVYPRPLNSFRSN